MTKTQTPPSTTPPSVGANPEVVDGSAPVDDKPVVEAPKPAPKKAKPKSKKKKPAEPAKVKPRPVVLFQSPADASDEWRPEKFKPQKTNAELKIPLAVTGDRNFESDILDIRNLTPKQTLGVCVLTDGMAGVGMMTDDGKEINSRQQAVRKLLEMIAEGVKR